MLTPGQITHFETFGFLVFRQLFDSDEMRIIDSELDRALEHAVRQAPDDAKKGQIAWSHLGPETPFLAGLLEDSRFIEAAEQLYGDDVVAGFSGGNRFVGNSTYWHPDIAEATAETKNRHQHALKFGFYLEPLNSNNGALRMIPGSHRSPFHDELFGIGLKEPGKGVPSPFLEASGLTIADIPAYIFESEPGDVFAFDIRMWHSSWGGDPKGRREGSLVYYANPRTPEEEQDTREHVARNARVRAGNVMSGPAYHPYWVENREGSAKRQRWIDWLRKWGFIA